MSQVPETVEYSSKPFSDKCSQCGFSVFGKITQYSCRVANRIALTMVFAETSNKRLNTQLMVDEALGASCELLDRIDPGELRFFYERFSNIYSTSGHHSLMEEPVLWSAFVGVQCDLLQRVGLHQKTIATLGTELANWSREPVSMDQFGKALDELAYLASDCSVALSVAIQQQAGNESPGKRQAVLFAHAICGITVVLVAIEEAKKKGESKDSACAALATFGASLVKQSVERLYEVCNLTSS